MAASLLFPCVAVSVYSVVTLLMVMFCFRFFSTGNNAAVLGRILRSYRSQSCLMELEAPFLGSKSPTIHGTAWGIHQLWSHLALPSPSLCPMPLLHLEFHLAGPRKLFLVLQLLDRDSPFAPTPAQMRETSHVTSD